MTDVNLLPWRELKREHEKKKWTYYLLGALVFATLLVIVVNRYYVQINEDQAVRNQRIQTEINQFKKQINEIKSLKSLKKGLIARMSMIQNLQATRTLTVRFFDELIKILPDDVYVIRVERKADKVSLFGYTESNSSISTLMRNIESSDLIQLPELSEIKTTNDNKSGVDERNQFKLSFILKPTAMPGS